MSRPFKLTVFWMVAMIAWLPLRSWTQEAGQAAQEDGQTVIKIEPAQQETMTCLHCILGSSRG